MALTKGEVERRLKELSKRLIKTLPVRKIIAAICDKGVPYLAITPVPRSLTANFFIEVSKTFDKELIPSFIERDDTLFIYFHPPQKVSKCEQLFTKETNLPDAVLRESNYACIDAYRQITDKNFNGLVFVVSEKCPSCQELEKFLYVEGAGAEDENELSMIEQILNREAIFIDMNTCPRLATLLSGGNVPTMIIFKYGKPVDKISGFENTDEYRKKWHDFIIKKAFESIE